MKNNDKDKIVPIESITLLKTVYEQIIEILSTLASRNFAQRDYQLNALYHQLVVIADKILFKEKNFFDEHDIQRPTIPEDIIGDIEDIDILWEEKISPEVYRFLGKIENILLEEGYPKYELTEELGKLFQEVDSALDRIIKQDEEDFAKLVAEKMDKNPFIKNEDRLFKPKVNRRLKTGSLRLDLTAGTLQYGDNSLVEISPNKIEIRFLAFLMSNPRIVKYEELGKELLSNPSNALPRDIQFLKRNLLAYLRKGANMPERQVKAISKMIEAIQGEGYKLRLT